MRDLADFLRWVQPYATACPEPVAENHIRIAARDFCAATRCWRFVTSVPVTDAPEVACVPPDAALLEIEEAQFDGRVLDRVRYIDTHDVAGNPSQITQIEPDSVRIHPHAVGSLTLSLFLQPAQHADRVPDFLYDRWAEVIGDGALAGILELPDQPYSDPVAASYRRARFEQAKDRNFNISMRGQQRAPARTRARFI